MQKKVSETWCFDACFDTDLHISPLKRFSSGNMPTVLEEELWLQMGKYTSLQWFTFEPGFKKNSV